MSQCICLFLYMIFVRNRLCETRVASVVIVMAPPPNVQRYPYQRSVEFPYCDYRIYLVVRSSTHTMKLTVKMLGIEDESGRL